MAFGISFGSNKTKTNQTKTVNSTETRNESGTQNTASQKGTQSTSVGTQTSTGQSATQQTGQQTSASTGTGSQVEESIRRLFSTGIQSDLEGLASNLLGGAMGISDQRAGDAAALGGFDPASFVSGGLARAESRVNDQLDEALGSMFSAIGGTSGSNSAAALLAQRMQTQAADELAGVESQLTGQAQEIMRNNVMAREGLAQGENQFLAQILSALRGGTEVTQASAQTQTSEQQAQQSAQQSQTQQSQTQQTVQQQQVMETLIEAIQKALSGTATTVGTENLKGTTTEKGGGFGLSL